jgi:serine/threonine protein kinase
VFAETNDSAPSCCPDCGDILCGATCDRCTQVAAAPDLDELTPGCTLGSYRILSLLREGGMGRVYVAEHVLLGRQVALKVLKPQLSANRQAVARFFSEARAVNRISHENIVEITDFCENGDGHNYLIMELLKGQDLGDLLLKIGVVPINRAVDIAIQIAGALTVVHEGRIIHRDLKPDNIYLIDRPSRIGFVKLLDFGVAKLTDCDGPGIQMGTTAEGMIIGTPEYMSPEQASGDTIDHRSDIYSLGVILYEMVTGVLPFLGNNFGELLVQLLTVEPKPPRSHPDLPHEIPPALEQLILHMLAKSAANRPQSMREIESELRAIHDDLMPFTDDPGSARFRRVSDRLPTLTTPAPTTSELAPKRRSRTRLVVASMVVLCAIASAGWFVLPDSAARPATVTTPPVIVAPLPQPTRPPTTPTPPADIAIEFRSMPTGAAVRVTGTDQLLGTTPFTHRFKREDAVRTFDFELATYAPATQEIAVTNDGAIAVALSPLPAVVSHTRAIMTTRPPTPSDKHVDRNSTMKVFD